jgi:hypothetical protein
MCHCVWSINFNGEAGLVGVRLLRQGEEKAIVYQEVYNHEAITDVWAQYILPVFTTRMFLSPSHRLKITKTWHE